MQALRHEHNLTIVKPFASIHIRYGDKSSEAPRQPLSKYMSILTTKRPDIKNVFVSTETESVLSELRKNYPSHNFQFFKYHRIESSKSWQTSDKQGEFTISIINLLVALQADVFVGSLTSNWCRLIHELERTRGDAGVDYLTVDSSQFAKCF